MIVTLRRLDRLIILIDDNEPRVVEPRRGVGFLTPPTIQLGLLQDVPNQRLTWVHPIVALTSRAHPVVARVTKMVKDVIVLPILTRAVEGVHRGFYR